MNNHKILSFNPKSPNFILIISYICLGLIGILRHSMWRDELNAWLVARDSNSLIEMFQAIKYEGHPGLWYLCLFVLKQITYNPISIQLFHFLLAASFTYLFIQFSPFTTKQKILFTLGYFPLYEYLVVSRNYAIGVLCLFAFCTIYKIRTRNYLPLAFLLLLMANSNAYCLFIAIALGVSLIAEYFWRKPLGYSTQASIFNQLTSFGIFLTGIILSFLQLIPPQDSILQGGVQLNIQFSFHHLVASLSRLWSSYILILVPGDTQFYSLCLFAVISICLAVFIFISLIKKPVIACFYLLATSEIIFFTYVKFLGSPRHYGHLYIIFITAIWLASYYSPSNLLLQPLSKLISPSWLKFIHKYRKHLLIVILSAQLIAGVVAYSRDLLVPYSASKETAQFIHRENLNDMFMVGSQDFAMAPLAGYLQRKLYYPESEKMGSFVLFNSQRREVDLATVLNQVNQLLSQEKKDILLILNYQLDRSSTSLSIEPLGYFTNSFIYNENYYLYKIKYE